MSAAGVNRAGALRRAAGMTLMELMMVVAIVGILAAVAYPSYRESVLGGRRSDGQSALLRVAQRLERCFTQFNAYDHDDCPVVLPSASPEGYYEVSAQSLTEDAFTLLATPQGAQADDTTCRTLSLSSAGARGAAGSNPSRCW